MGIDDIIRKYSSNESEFKHILFVELDKFKTNYCSEKSCKEYNCNNATKYYGCFETYLLTNNYHAAPNLYDRRKEERVPEPEIKKKKKKK